MKSLQEVQRMAVIFCLFAFTLCNHIPADNQVIENYNEHSLNYQKAGSLAAQIVSVPKNNISPCPQVFRYIFDGSEWAGALRVQNPAPRGYPSFLRVQMTVGFNYKSVSFKKFNFSIFLQLYSFKIEIRW